MKSTIAARLREIADDIEASDVRIGGVGVVLVDDFVDVNLSYVHRVNASPDWDILSVMTLMKAMHKDVDFDLDKYGVGESARSPDAYRPVSDGPWRPVESRKGIHS